MGSWEKVMDEKISIPSIVIDITKISKVKYRYSNIDIFQEISINRYFFAIPCHHALE